MTNIAYHLSGVTFGAQPSIFSVDCSSVMTVQLQRDTSASYEQTPGLLVFPSRTDCGSGLGSMFQRVGMIP